MKRGLLLCLLVVSASGCSTYAASKYSVNTDTDAALKTMRGKTANVGEFTSSGQSKTEISCRAVGPIKTPNGETYAEYLREGFIAELKTADLFDEKAPVTLTANLDSLDFDSSSGHWRLMATMKSTNGKSVSASEDYKYESSFFGEKACALTAQALLPAMQDLIMKLVRTDGFPALLEPPATTP